MDTFEANKLAGAILFTLMMALGLGILAEIVFTPARLAKPGYELADAPPAGTAAPAEEADKPVAFYLAHASIEKGEAKFKVCLGCHTIAKGAKPAIGPNLWGVMGGPKAHESDYAYSDAMKARGTKGEKWPIEEMFAFLKAPGTYVQGTKMTYQGMPNPQDRANVLLYVHSQADTPVPLPTAQADAPAATPASAPGKPGAAPAAGPKPSTQTPSSPAPTAGAPGAPMQTAPKK